MTITTGQREFRQGRIGSSDAAAAVGKSKWETPAKLWARLTGRIPPVAENMAMIIGNHIEPIIGRRYTEQTWVEIEPYGDTLVHPEYDFIVAHPDFKAKDGSRLVEIKNVGYHSVQYWGEDGDPNGVPDYVYWQCVQQAMLANISRVDVAAQMCLSLGEGDPVTELRVYPLNIPEEDKLFLLNGVLKFWGDYVERDVMPPLNDADTALMRELHPAHTPNEVKEANELIIHYIKTAKAAKDEADLLKKIIDEHQALIFEYMGTAEALLDHDGNILCTWKKAKDSAVVDWKDAFQTLHKLLKAHMMDEKLVEELVGSATAMATLTKTGARSFLNQLKKGDYDGTGSR